MKPPKRHHFLPKCYLREFSRDGLVWVFDRETKKTRRQLIVDTAVKNHFYSATLEDGTKDAFLETQLSKHESSIPDVFERLRSNRVISLQDRSALCVFAAFMMHRGPDFHEGVQKMEGTIIKQLTKAMLHSEESAARLIAGYKSEHPENTEFVDPKKLVEFAKRGDFEVTITRNRSLHLMCSLSPEFAKTFSKLDISILHAPKGSAFLTSDRPLVIVPTRHTPPLPQWAGVGILTPGAQKYLPLASDLLLAFGDVGENAKHTAVTRRTVMAINSFVAEMTDRFLLGRDEALVEAFVKRLNLRHLPKLETFSIM